MFCGIILKFSNWGSASKTLIEIGTILHRYDDMNSGCKCQWRNDMRGISVVLCQLVGIVIANMKDESVLHECVNKVCKMF